MAFIVVCGLVVAELTAMNGCGGTSTLPFPKTATEIPSATRHPDGVVLEPPSALPGVTVRADARGVVALREPLGDDAIRAVVKQIVSAFEEKDPTTLESLLSDEVAYYEGGRKLTRSNLVDVWRRRMSQLDYSKLAGMDVVRVEKIQRFEYDELGGQGEPARPPDMQQGDLFVKVPIEISQVGGEKLFGDAWFLTLRQEAGILHISGITEVNAE